MHHDENAKELAMNIKHIVVGTDFSPQAEVAAQHALHIARAMGADITLVHACPILEPPASTVATQWGELMQRQLMENRDRLENMRSGMTGHGINVFHEMADDVPDTAVTDVAARIGADLVIVGTHGFTGVKHLLLGSVAEKVIRHSAMSAMVARPLEHLHAGYRNLLVPTDFSEGAEYALEMATTLAADGASIQVWHWWQSPYGGPMPDPEALRVEIEGGVRAAGEELVQRHRNPRYRLSFQVAEAPATSGIQEQLAGGNGYDLVVVGSHGRRGLTRWLLGSFAEAAARHAPCSVLVARRRTGQ
jgi:nucleotide-binding universal stress UspA family protein